MNTANTCTDLIFNHIKNNENSKLELTFSKCPNLNINKLKNKEGETLLLHAIKHNNIIGTNFLLKLGAVDNNNNNNNNNNNTNNGIYTFAAIGNGNLDMLTLLKNNNFSLHKVDNNGNNLLHHYLLSNNNLDDNIVIFLLKENISLTSKNNNEQTPLDIIQSMMKKQTNQTNDIIKLIETRIRMKTNIDANQNECNYSNLSESVNNPISPLMSDNIDDFKENSKRIYTSYYYPKVGEVEVEGEGDEKCMDFIKVEEEDAVVVEEEGKGLKGLKKGNLEVKTKTKEPFINLREKLASIRKGKENYENYLENQNNTQHNKDKNLILITIIVLLVIFIIKIMNKA